MAIQPQANERSHNLVIEPLKNFALHGKESIWIYLSELNLWKLRYLRGYKAAGIANWEEYIPPYVLLSWWRIWKTSLTKKRSFAVIFPNLVALQLNCKENTSFWARAIMGLDNWCSFELRRTRAEARKYCNSSAPCFWDQSKRNRHRIGWLDCHPRKKLGVSKLW